MSKSLNLTKDPIGPLLRKIAIPASVGTLFQTLFNIVDTFFAGKISPEALSALAKSFPIYFIIIAACVGVTVGGNSLIANSIGEKNKKNVLIYFGQTIIFGIILSVIITFIGLYYASDIFFMMGSTNEVVNLGLQYTDVIFSGSIVFISVVALNSLLHAEGDTKTFRNVLILSFVLNIFLNPLFIFGYGFIPAMGMMGIGVATIISQIIAFFILLTKIMKSSSLKGISIKNFFPNSFYLSKIFFSFDFEAFRKELFIFSAVKFFDEENTNSTRDTLGVGTLIEIPSTLPFNSVKTSPRDFVAPVVVGIIELGPLRALLKSLWELSNNLWSVV